MSETNSETKKTVAEIIEELESDLMKYNITIMQLKDKLINTLEERSRAVDKYYGLKERIMKFNIYELSKKNYELTHTT